MNELRQAGLTENESKVYLALLDLGPSLAGQIARKSGLHRRNVYDTTEMLIKKGLIGYILENNRRLFKASHPKRFLEIIKEKEEVLAPVIRELEDKYSNRKSRQETLFYKGKDGLKTVFESQLQEKEILMLGANKDASKILPFYFNWYNKKRTKKKINTRIITHSRDFSKLKGARIKYLPEKYSSPVAINIFGNNVAIIHWTNEPLAIVIKSEEIAKGYKNYFELMWKIAKE